METKVGLIKYLLKRGYGSLSPPPLRNISNRSDSSAAHARGELRYEAMLAERAKLEAMSFDEIQSLAGKARHEDAEARAAKLREEDAQLVFNRAGSSANFDYWGRMPTWTLDEAIALSLGKSPSVVNWESVSMSGAHYVPEALRLSPFPAEYARRRDMVQRAVGAGEIEFVTNEDQRNWRSTVRPEHFLTWASGMLDSLPDELTEQVRARGKRITDLNTVTAERDALAARLAELESAITPAVPPEKPLAGRERQSLLRLIRALGEMANLPDRGATTSIETQLQTLGFTAPREATIRKLITEARALEQD